jgi:hypothetical protein
MVAIFACRLGLVTDPWNSQQHMPILNLDNVQIAIPVDGETRASKFFN